MGCHFLLQGIFLAQGLNPGLLHCRQRHLLSEPLGKSPSGYRLEMGVSGNLWIDVKDVKTLVVYDVKLETAVDSKKGKCASS